MDELQKRIANLSPAKRAFLDRRVTGLAKNTVVSPKRERDLAPLVFRSEGKGTPLFLLHYLTPSQVLAKYLGSDRPIFGIDSAFEEELYLWEESGRIAVSVEELARRCLVELQTAQPRGPYFLAGFCFGGALAFEVAKQLRMGGERVAFLGLLDSFYIPGVDPMSVPWLTIGGADEKSADTTEPDEVRRRIAFMREIVKPYRSEPYPGGAVLFRAMVNRDPSWGVNGWDKVIMEDLQIEDCQSTRKGFFEEPFVRELTARLAEHLSRADDRYCKGAVEPTVVAVPEHARPQSNGGFVAPLTPVETTLAGIWSALLQVEQVGAHDKFFELGGDSILAIQVITRAKKAGLRLTLKQIFQHQTIAELALVTETVTDRHFEQGLITGEVPSTSSDCTSASASVYTPSDFSEAGLDQQELDRLIAELGEE